MYRPFYRVSIWETRDEKKTRITYQDFKAGTVLQMREAAFKLIRHWESVEPPDRLFEHTVELYYWWGDLPKEYSVFIYCYDYALTAKGLAREAYIFAPWPEADFHWVRMLDVIGNNLEQILILGHILKDEEFEEFPQVIQERSEITIGTLPQRRKAYESKRRRLGGDDKEITIDDLPF